MIDVTCGNCGEVAGQTDPKANWFGKCESCGAKIEYIANLSANRAAAYSIGAPEDPSQAEPTPPPDGTRVMCPSCGKNLLGIWQDGALHVRHKGREWISYGVLGIPCHEACGEILAVDTRTYSVTVVASLSDLARSIEPPPPATDAAKALAVEHGIDLRDVKPTGAKGTVVKADVEALVGAH